MKTTQPSRCAYFNVHTLIGLAAFGIALTAIVVYGAGRTGNSKAPRQRLPSGPSPHGSVTEAWVRRIDGPVHGNDHGHDVAIDSVGNVLVTGWIETATGNSDCHTVKYSPNGDVLWADTYAGSATGTDYGYTLAVDQNGNTYVGGFGNGDNPATFDIFVLKYDSDGNRVWTQRWASPITNYSAYAYSIAVDNQGNVFTTGFMSDGLTDGEFITLKFNSSGVLQWATPYNGSTSSIDYATALSLIVTGIPTSPAGAAVRTICTISLRSNTIRMETRSGSDDTTVPQTTMITLTGWRWMLRVTFTLPVKAWKPVLTMTSPRSNTLRMEMRFGLGITMARPMVMTRAKLSLSMPMATPTSQVITP